jgi:hypothetical protein
VNVAPISTGVEPDACVDHLSRPFLSAEIGRLDPPPKAEAQSADVVSRDSVRLSLIEVTRLR